ncbi:MAG TPA: SDR family oxidoreductase [Pyrinomonadaceae bacterium]
MKILIFGGTGMLGHKLVQQWRDKFEVYSTVRSDFSRYENVGLSHKDKVICRVEVDDIESVRNAVKISQPDVIVNCVGIIKQLPTSKNVIRTLTVNSIFPHRLAEIANESKARLITISTDCVFNGKKGNYKEEDVSDAEDVYGKSKNLGEINSENCLTIRTSIIGRELETAHSLVEWFLSNRGGKVRGFTNAIYSGFPTVVLAEIIAGLIVGHKNLSGLYHVSSEPIDKYRLLCLIRDAFNADIEVEPFDDFRIDRSLDSTKFREATGFVPESWEAMIKKMAGDSFPYEEVRKQLITK